jgi:hypothetical protein
VLCEGVFVANSAIIANSRGDDINPTTHNHAANNDVPMLVASRATTPLTSPTSVQTMAIRTDKIPRLVMPRMARIHPKNQRSDQDDPGSRL